MSKDREIANIFNQMDTDNLVEEIAELTTRAKSMLDHAEVFNAAYISGTGAIGAEALRQFMVQTCGASQATIKSLMEVRRQLEAHKKAQMDVMGYLLKTIERVM